MGRLLTFSGTFSILQSDWLTTVVPIGQTASQLADSILTYRAFPQVERRPEASLSSSSRCKHSFTYDKALTNKPNQQFESFRTAMKKLAKMVCVPW